MVRSDSFESRLIARLVTERFSYPAILTYLKSRGMNHPRLAQSLRYHADAHDVSLTDSRNDPKSIKQAARQVEGTHLLKLKRA